MSFTCFSPFLFFVVVFFFKQKTAYEMRISDWSSDVCSSDLWPGGGVGRHRNPRKRLKPSDPAFEHLIGRSMAVDPDADVGDHLVAHRRAALDRRRAHVRQQDRTSTRLNSSH